MTKFWAFWMAIIYRRRPSTCALVDTADAHDEDDCGSAGRSPLLGTTRSPCFGPMASLLQDTARFFMTGAAGFCSFVTLPW